MAARELARPPGTGVLLAKAALQAAARAALRWPRRGPSSRSRSSGAAGSRPAAELPDVEVVLPGVRVDAGHLAAYARVCGFALRDELPPTYPHVLAFPLALRLMTARDFPFPLLGLVHVANAITLTRPLRLDEPLTLRVRTGGLRGHRRGRQFDLVHEAIAGGEPVWRDVSTYLRRERRGELSGQASGALSGEPAGQASGQASGESAGALSGEPAGAPPAGPGGHAGEHADRAGWPAAAPANWPVADPAVWRVGGDTGRRYAAVSGDRNPIHLHPLAARAFGFRHAIAHGMWTKARCLAELAGRLPRAYTVEVSFTRPVPLPATVAFAAARDAAGWRFTVRDAGAGRPHLTGTLGPA